MSNTSIWPIDKTLSGATTLAQSGPRSMSNEGVLHIPQTSSITGDSPSDCLVSYPGHSLGGGPADWAGYLRSNPIYTYNL